MSVFGRLYRGETHFDFVGKKRVAFTVSAVLLTVSVLSLVFVGLNLGVDFDGGTVIEADNPAGASVEELRDVLREFGLDNATVQLTTGATEGVRVQTEIIEDPAEENAVVEAIADVTGVQPNDVSVTAVGPAFGEEVTRSAVRALVIFLIVISIFITLRFEWKMALAALVALFHDLLLTAGVYSITGFEVTPATVVAILTILGYSLYDTVVVFDKIVETVQISEGRRSLRDVINDSMNSVLMRSLNTSLTSLLPVGCLLFIGSILLGATTLQDFALALFVGVAAGTYSSIFVAAPLLATWKAGEEQWRDLETAAAPVAPPPRPAPMAAAPTETAAGSKKTAETPAPKPRKQDTGKKRSRQQAESPETGPEVVDEKPAGGSGAPPRPPSTGGGPKPRPPKKGRKGRR